ncbi:MAG: ABC transporter permease, partial [Planococcus sp. (in: Bacteria)]|nr:ABC transporter permease [Planococcus sp. (in: firmicutes)]
MGVEWGRIIELWPEIQTAFFQTLTMIGISLAVALIVGLPLGILLFITDRGLFLENRPVNAVIGFIVN